MGVNVKSMDEKKSKRCLGVAKKTSTRLGRLEIREFLALQKAEASSGDSFNCRAVFVAQTVSLHGLPCFYAYLCFK